MYKDLEYYEESDKMLLQLKKGIFITTKVNDKVNTMTIAWGSISIVWGKPIFMAFVRYSRNTYKMLENANEFTINVPLSKSLKDKLSFCGTKSRRDFDKIKECGLTLVDGRKIKTPIIADCDLHYECKIIYKQAMEPGMILDSIKDRYYPKDNYHVVFYGEIIDTYLYKER